MRSAARSGRMNSDDDAIRKPEATAPATFGALRPRTFPARHVSKPGSPTTVALAQSASDTPDSTPSAPSYEAIPSGWPGDHCHGTRHRRARRPEHQDQDTASAGSPREPRADPGQHGYDLPGL